MRSETAFRIFQAINFQILWFVCVLGGNSTLIIAFGLLALHFVLTRSRKLDTRLLWLALPGLFVDLTLWRVGLYEFTAPPIWLTPLWLFFGISLGHSLNWLTRLPSGLIMLLGALCGASSYLAAWRLGAVTFPHGVVIAGGVIAAFWAIALPLLVQRYRSMHALPANSML